MRTVIIAVSTKYAFKKIFFSIFHVIQSIACTLQKKVYHIWHFIIKFDWIFYDTFDNISFQVYAKVSVITFLVFFFTWYVYDFFIGFSGLWNNEIDYSIFLLPTFSIKAYNQLCREPSTVIHSINISVFFAWAHLIIEFSLYLLTYCFFLSWFY